METSTRIGKKFLHENEIINYLICICFEIDKKDCFEFDTTGNDSYHVYLFVGLDQNIILQELCRLQKLSDKEKF